MSTVPMAMGIQNSPNPCHWNFLSLDLETIFAQMEVVIPAFHIGNAHP